MNRYLLCRPEGGINDMLRQIGLCFDYCLRFDRILVIDTAGTTIFTEPFARYFEIRHPRLRLETDVEAFLHTAETRRLTLFPADAFLRHDRNIPANRYRRIRLDFDRDHAADVLMHHSSGGGRPSAVFLRSLRLHADLARSVATRWRAMPKPYVGVQIRNTDYRSDPSVVAPVLKRRRGPVYLATDSAAAQRDLLALRRDLVFTAPIPDFGGAALHLTAVSAEEKSRLNRLALEDLLMLALAERVHVSNPESGFSDLAKRLNGRQRMVVGWFATSHIGTRLALALRLNWLRNQFWRTARR